VAAGLAHRCEVQIAYAIGVAEPVSIMVETFGTSSVPPEKLEAAIRNVFDLTPLGIIKALELRKPIYRPTAAYGHFGRTPEPGTSHDVRVNLFTWEDPKLAPDLQDAVRRA
jgi:S-adenosylmethionine synthetase